MRRAHRPGTEFPAYLRHRYARPVSGGTDIGDRCEQGVLPEVVGLPPCDLLQQVGLDSAAECRCCQHSEPELAVLPAAESALRQEPLSYPFPRTPVGTWPRWNAAGSAAGSASGWIARSATRATPISTRTSTERPPTRPCSSRRGLRSARRSASPGSSPATTTSASPARDSEGEPVFLRGLIVHSFGSTPTTTDTPACPASAAATGRDARPATALRRCSPATGAKPNPAPRAPAPR